MLWFTFQETGKEKEEPSPDLLLHNLRTANVQKRKEEFFIVKQDWKGSGI